MTQQLGLDMDEQPKAPRAAVLRHAYLRSQPVPADEALALEARCEAQDARVLDLFREAAKDADDENPEAGQRLTPSMVLVSWGIVYGGAAPLLTSVRRALTNLTRRGLLQHHPRDRRPGPRGARESTWSLA